MSVGFDDVAFINAVVKASISGMNSALEFAEEHARKHAPVRRIFRTKGTWRGPASLQFAPISMAEAVSHDQFRYHPFNAQAMEEFKRARTYNRQMFLPGKQVQYQAHANSLVPIFKSGNEKISGDFRLVNVKKNRLYSVPYSKQIGPLGYEVTGGTEKLGLNNKKDRVSAQNINIWSAKDQNMVTSRGRYEISHSRSYFTGKDKQTRVGGRLRGEIHRTPAMFMGDRVVGRVISPTYYAKFQEYGTRRHRAQPYMRPALYETRKPFVNFVKNALREMLKTTYPRGPQFRFTGTR